MIIPEITFHLKAPESLASGTYPIRVVGVAAAEENSPDRRLVEAQTTMIMGPLLDVWNYVRRPLPNISMTVSEPFEAALSARARNVSLDAGKSITVELTAEHVPEDSEIEVKDLPAGIQWRMLGRQGDQITLQIQAPPQSAEGTYDISAQAKVAGRWASSEIIGLSIHAPPAVTARN
jgi:hypothetical protein